MEYEMNTVIELPKDMRDPMRREVNKGLMVRFINADLIERCNLDVRKSFVLYDADGLFDYAIDHMPSDEKLQRLYDHTNVRYWSKGI
jgi:hypothetical protein